jgi:hypothetical protein
MLTLPLCLEAWRFSSETFTGVPPTGIDGFLPAIPRPVSYSLGMSPTFPQAVSPLTLRSERFLLPVAMGQKSKSCCA